MKKKIMALIMVIPLIFMFTIFSASSYVSVTVDVPASGIAFDYKTEDGVVYIDLATYKGDISVSASVKPSQAKNKKFEYSVVNTEGDPKIIISKSNIVTASNEGKAKIIVTAQDGGFSDSITVVVTSSKVIDLGLQLATYPNNELVELKTSSNSSYDYETSLDSGMYKLLCVTVPKNSSAEGASFLSSNPSIATISASGVITFALSGSVVISAIENNGVNGTITRKVLVNVNRLETKSGITVNGQDNTVLNATTGIGSVEGKTVVNCFVEVPSTLTELSLIETKGKSDFEVQFSKLNESTRTRSIVATDKYKAVITFNSNVANGEQYRFAITSSGEVVDDYTLTVDFAPLAVQLYAYDKAIVEDETYSDFAGVGTKYWLEFFSLADDLIASWEASNINVSTKTSSDTFSCVITKPINLMTFTLKVKISSKSTNQVLLTKEYKIATIPFVSSINFDGKYVSKGISKTVSVGSNVVDSSGVEKSVNSIAYVATSGTNKLPRNPSDFEFVANSKGGELLINSNGEITEVLTEGYVEIVIRYKYNIQGVIEAKLVVYAVKDGVHVSTSNAFLTATDAGKRVILDKDIKLGEGMTDQQIANRLANNTFVSTYNTQYLRNRGWGQTLNYGVELKNDLHGNGFAVVGELFTKTDSTGAPSKYFNGPLTFVGVGDSGDVKVYGQDNCLFLVRTDDVVINNVQLYGRDPSLFEGELAYLEYSGTVLEVNASMQLLNSRVGYGRNAVRVYGGNKNGGNYYVPVGYDISKDKIDVVIDSCIIQVAREFLLKIGTNLARQATYTPKTENSEEKYNFIRFTNADGKEYNPTENNTNDKYFVDNYLVTSVILRDCVLGTSGLFAIGVESNFSGGALVSKDSSLGKLMEEVGNKIAEALGQKIMDGWDKLAGTSFASNLSLEGNVVIYDWKPTTNLNSETLIKVETGGGLGSSEFASFLKYFQLNFDALIRVASRVNNYEILDRQNNTNLVFGGICVYGGGANYANIDFSKLNEDCYLKGLNYYKINIDNMADAEEVDFTADELENGMLNVTSMQGMALPMAAGVEDFRFFLFNGKSQFNYLKQLEDIASGKAYDVAGCMIKK